MVFCDRYSWTTRKFIQLDIKIQLLATRILFCYQIAPQSCPAGCSSSLTEDIGQVINCFNSSGNLVTKAGLKTQEQHDMLPSSNNRRQYMGYITCNSKGNKVQDKGKCFEQSSCKLLSKHGQQIYEKHDNNSMLLTKET